ncbi:MAG: HD domain-containing protein [Spirochaetaceae bacterium]|nr:HD domain-containing protein [Spirochaetaceae bacterium]
MNADDVRSVHATNPVAAIEVGSTGIRLLVASIDESGSIRVLDKAGKPSRIGRDVFTQGSIGREAIREVIAVLISFKELLNGYGIKAEGAKVIGTSALREASNRDTFVDKVALQTGFRIRVIEEIEENHLMYLAVQQALQDEPSLLSRSNAMILEVGGGTTEIMLLKRGKMASTHSLHIGTLRLDEQIREAGSSRSYLHDYLESNIKTTCDLMGEDLPLASIKTFIVIGSDARLAAASLAKGRPGSYSMLDREQYIHFAESISKLSPEECIAKYHLPWEEAGGLSSGLIIESLFLERTGAEKVIIPNVSIREGLLLAEARGLDPAIEAELKRQVLASAHSLGKRYRYDEQHARNVSSLSLAIFDYLAKDHGLGPHERLLLEVSAILHDIGTFIRASGHHRHGEYIVSNSEIFGLNREDVNIVSNVVRYHRRNPPSPTHVSYISLARENRIIVMKLSAILRVADALDRNHTGRVSGVDFERSEDKFIIRSAQNLDYSLERLSLADKGDMFEDVFGLIPVLV